MKRERCIEVLVRGVYVKDGRLLYCRSRNGVVRYLPGGHVEFGEPAREALIRELNEELGVEIRVGRFLGVVEHAFDQKGTFHSEINLVFQMMVPVWEEKTGVPSAPPSREEKIRFGWMGLDDLSGSSLEPAVLQDLLPVWLKSKAAGWGSSM